ncbi:MAG TPA: hypothetical protein VM574_01625, partial [Terrimicrobiaceae bacterium]|nr:hypothetical protein [Terrimicrobiaceae bacterium]
PGENFVELEGNSPQGVLRILEEELVERRLQAEKRAGADRDNQKNIGEPTKDYGSAPATCGHRAHADIEQIGARQIAAQPSIHSTWLTLISHSVVSALHGK